jgi:tRNA(fMet)-specific endonuclease VapC
MKHVLVDTNVLADFFAGVPDAVETFQRATSLGLNTVVLGELLAGFALGSRVTQNRRLLSGFLSSPRVNLLPLVAETAEHYAGILWQLKRKGKPIPSNDIWVAASAMEHGLVLLTRDSHFQSIDGLLTASTVDELLL